MAKFIARGPQGIVDDLPYPGPGNTQAWLPKIVRRFQMAGHPAQIAYDLILAAIYAEHQKESHPSDVARVVNRIYGGELTATGNGEARSVVPAFEPDKLREVAVPIIDVVSSKFVMQRSRVPVSQVTPSGYLDRVSPGKTAQVFNRLNALKGFMYSDPSEAAAMERYAAYNENGAWFLSNPVDGQEHGESWRSEANLTDYSHMVLESDDAPEMGLTKDWLAMLLQADLAIVSLVWTGTRVSIYRP